MHFQYKSLFHTCENGKRVGGNADSMLTILILTQGDSGPLVNLTTQSEHLSGDMATAESEGGICGAPGVQGKRGTW